MLYHEAVLLQRKGRFEAAQEALEELCYHGVQDHELTRSLGMVALRIPAPNGATGATLEGDIVMAVGEAECLAAHHKFDEAKQVYSGLEQRYPDCPNLHYAFGRFLLEARDPEPAKKEFEQELKNNPRPCVRALGNRGRWLQG
jgi:tetratricopeptide (TPR) repeat protein